MAEIIQLRRDTAANWASSNPILADGEIGFDKTNKIFKIGNGTDAWSVLLALNLDSFSGHGADIASAATLNLDGATGDLIDVTGTTTITAITLSEGRIRTVRFTGILTLTNGASLVLPGGANITTAAGDFAIFRGYASGVVRCVSYQKASGTPGGGGAILGTTIPNGSSIASSGTRYAGLISAGANTAVFQSSEGLVGFVMPTGGTLSKLFVVANAGTVGSGTITSTIRKNGVDTALVAVSPQSDITPASDVTHTVSVAAGDIITLKVVNSDGAAGTVYSYSVKFS